MPRAKGELVPDSIRHAANCGNCKFGLYAHVIGDHVSGLCCFHSSGQTIGRYGVMVTAEEYRKRGVIADELCDEWRPFEAVHAAISLLERHCNNDTNAARSNAGN